MQTHSFDAQYSDGRTKVSFSVGVYLFKEGETFIAYCPALDVSGYGNTETESKESFAQSVGMYIEYCLHKNTLVQDLQKHGWSIKSMKQRKIKAPDFDTMLRNNEDFREIIETKDYTKYSENVRIPVMA